MKFLAKLNEIKSRHPDKKISIIIGFPVEHSLSPAMHNNAYKDLKIYDEYAYDKLEVKEDELREFFVDLKHFNIINGCIIGLTCTMPHKINIIQYLDSLGDEAKVIKAVNSVFFDGQKYIGYNTDWYGIERPFKERGIHINNKKVAIIGAGGASRACVYAFKKNDCLISIFNRTIEKAKVLAEEFGCEAFELKDNDDKIGENDIIVNMTNVGMGDLVGKSPVKKEVLKKNHIIFECIYKPSETKLAEYAKEVGAEVILGYEMLLYQGVKQFEIYTSKIPRVEAMKEVL